MKKFNAFELIGIGVAIYLVCLIFGAISKHIFSFDVDVLSASATLFAAVVAMLLFNDWREPHNAQRIHEERKDIINAIKSFRTNFYNFINHIDTMVEAAKTRDESYCKEYIELETKLLNDLDDYLDCLHIYAINYSKNSSIEEKIHFITLEKSIQKVKEIYELLIKENSTTDFDHAYTHIMSSKTQDELFKIGLDITVTLRDEILKFNKKGQ